MTQVPTKLGRYEIVKHLANGGMAQVLIARATGIEGFERHVVVKRIHQEHAADPAFVQMFLDEARTAAALHHNNIVQVHDIGKENGEYFFAMEYVHGQDLRMLLKEASRQKHKVPWEHVITIMTSAAAGLHHAHELRGSDRKLLGLVHRDVSPANILIGYDGTVKMVDFGIAKAALRTGEGTRGGALKGKVSYMAPEQCAGKPIDRRSDVYALGVVLYELSTVRRLFKGDNDFLTMSAIVAGDLPHPSAVRPDIPDEFSVIILKALAKKAADRYQTADEMREALEEVANQLKLRTSTGALATYMKSMFGAQPEPWLVQEDAELELTVDFDGSASGMAKASEDAALNLAIPEALDPVASAPILRARRRATGAPPSLALPATGSSGTARASGTGAGEKTPLKTPAAGTPVKPPTIMIPPKDGPATARTTTRIPPAPGGSLAISHTPPAGMPAIARTTTPPAGLSPAIARTTTPPAGLSPAIARTATASPTTNPSTPSPISAATATPVTDPASPALPRTATSARSAATIGAPPRTKNPTATPPVGVGRRATPLPPGITANTAATPPAVTRSATPAAGVPTRVPLPPPRTPVTGVPIDASKRPPSRTPPAMPIAVPVEDGATAPSASDANGATAPSANGAKAASASDANGAKAETAEAASGSGAKPAAKVATADAGKSAASSDKAVDEKSRLPTMADDDFTIEESKSRDDATKDIERAKADAKGNEPDAKAAKAADKPAAKAAKAADKPDAKPVAAKADKAAVVAAEPIATTPDPKKKLMIGGGVALLAILLIIFLAKRGGGSDEPTEPTPPTRGSSEPVKQPPPVPDASEPAGSAVEPAGSAVEPAGSAVEPAGSAVEPAGSAVEPAGSATHGSATEPAGSASGSADAGSGSGSAVKKRRYPPKKKWNPDELFIKP